MTYQSGRLANNKTQNLKHSSKMDFATTTTTTTILKIIFSNQNLRNVSAHFNILVDSRQQQMQQQITTNGECLSSFQCFWISDCFKKFKTHDLKSIIEECLNSFQGFYFHLWATNATTMQQEIITNGECLSSFQFFDS